MEDSIHTSCVLDADAARRLLGRCRSRLSHFPNTYAQGADLRRVIPPRPDPQSLSRADVAAAVAKPHNFCPSRYASIRTLRELTLFAGSVHYEIRLHSD
jgi:hypothetical protein